MATRITKNQKRSDTTPAEQLLLQGLDPDQTIAVALNYHSTGIKWDRQAKTITIDVGEFSNRYKVGDDTQLIITKDPQPADPPEDILDPETGEVVVAAGSIHAAIPRLNTILDKSIPAALRNQTTYGDLLKNLLKANDLLLRLLRPEYAAGTNVDDDVSER